MADANSTARETRNAFSTQRFNARYRGIEWRLTFEEWWSIWESSEHWAERGRRKGNYVMSRRGDAGAYAHDNVRIVTNKENFHEARSHAQPRDGVYCTHPGTSKPWMAKFARKQLGYFATEAEARVVRAAAVAEYLAAPKVAGKREFTAEHRRRLSEAQKAVGARKREKAQTASG